MFLFYSYFPTDECFELLENTFLSTSGLQGGSKTVGGGARKNVISTSAKNTLKRLEKLQTITWKSRTCVHLI